MTTGARTPEELETLLEDASLLHDRDALAGLFEDGAVLVADREARGGDAIAAALSDRTYLAQPRRVLQARDTALVVGEQSINVVRRGSDGAWRFAISLLSASAKEER